MRVVAAIDDSPSTRAVLSTAITAAHTIGAEAVAVHVRNAGEPPRDAARTAGVPLELLDGDTVSAIIETFGAADSALGVIGARRDAGDHRFAGSIALAIITRASTPVLVVGPHVRHHIPDRFTRILVPLDGTPASAAAAREVAALFAVPDVDVVVQHAFSGETAPAFWDQAQHAHESWSREFLARWYDQPGARVTWRCGKAADVILESATSERAEVIALAWAQDISAGRAAVVKNALLRADVPVLLVPVVRQPALPR